MVYIVSMAVFTPHHSLAVVMDSVWDTKPKIFTKWPLKVTDPVLHKKLVSMTLKSLGLVCYLLIINSMIT